MKARISSVDALRKLPLVVVAHTKFLFNAMLSTKALKSPIRRPLSDHTRQSVITSTLSRSRIRIFVIFLTGKGPGADYPSPGFAGGSGGGHGGLGGRAVSQVTTGGAYGSITEPDEFGKMYIS